MFLAEPLHKCLGETKGSSFGFLLFEFRLVKLKESQRRNRHALVFPFAPHFLAFGRSRFGRFHCHLARSNSPAMLLPRDSRLGGWLVHAFFFCKLMGLIDSGSKAGQWCIGRLLVEARLRNRIPCLICISQPWTCWV